MILLTEPSYSNPDRKCEKQPKFSYAYKLEVDHTHKDAESR